MIWIRILSFAYMIFFVAVMYTNPAMIACLPLWIIAIVALAASAASYIISAYRSIKYNKNTKTKK